LSRFRSPPVSASYTGPTELDRQFFATLRSVSPAERGSVLGSLVRAGRLGEGLLEASLQALQVARRERTADEADLESLARLIGTALAQSSAQPMALLLSDLMEALERGETEPALLARLRTALQRTGVTAQALASTAEQLAAAATEQEKTLMQGVSDAVVQGGEAAEIALQDAERRTTARRRLATIAALARSSL
jgi:hypothetical protein